MTTTTPTQNPTATGSRTVVLDDDPTGTQAASGVQVLLECDADRLEAALRGAGSVYVQTNSRALDEATAVALVTRVREDALEAGRRLGVDVRFVLRGDSTLRGHVFAETGVFAGPDDVVLLVPAFPAGGRTTVDGVHLVRTADGDVPVGETEYAADPVFGFRSSRLVDYVAEKSGRTGVGVPLVVVRDPAALAGRFAQAPAGSVLVPDVETDADVAALADAVRGAGREVVVRCAAPLAAALAGVVSTGLLPRPLVPHPPRTLVVCGSHTAGAQEQLRVLGRTWGEFEVVATADALDDPVAAGRELAERAGRVLARQGVVTLASERVRMADHGTLAHGEAVMTALTTAVRELLPQVDAVVSKGGITAAEVARTGLGATSALVEGQVAAGISVWRMTARDGREVHQVVVPGNVGGPDAVADAVAALGPAPR
ncbi:four-carbon acid sugar kinase family protein [Kineococcus radiotolerans]|uniref:four-carbon acid sugar kinase family protein n=1 Tax=Kineococcus radiotolerans TaxID=131568 RepID=UPI0002D85998|nr:four-carbon acid sugar kinase family protein [Kineococcus radiotolerans]